MITTFYDWDETLLTWCDTCGNDSDDVGRMRQCPDCDDNICIDCHKEHIKWCDDTGEE